MAQGKKNEIRAKVQREEFCLGGFCTAEFTGAPKVALHLYFITLSVGKTRVLEKHVSIGQWGQT